MSHQTKDSLLESSSTANLAGKGYLSFSGTHQGQLIRDGALTSADLIEAHVARIAEVNPP